ncbi:DJ-1/PfpI family protein [Desulfovibrio sp.]|uniref:DJ-1/PfpI family protein n=1 Tax=Desulfovibrio sp. TaxID=885 RepID=UPI0025C6F631|nr:DJ-1/PfpI family protein [Desulfovibrio sp.]
MHSVFQRCLQPLTCLLVLLASTWPLAVQAQTSPAQASPAQTAGMYDAIPASAARQVTLGVLIFPGFEMLDAYGPMEMWGSLKHAPDRFWGEASDRVGIRLVTVAASKGAVPSNQGPKTVADFDYTNAPALDYLLVPGGIGAIPLVNDQATLSWLRAQAKNASLVMSVCNGASLLAAAGRRGGGGAPPHHPATTNKMAFKASTAPGPKVRWVASARWVDNGNIVTSSGVSAGMDMTVAVIARLYGQPLSNWVAQVTEYEPHSDPAWDPFAVKAGLVR